MDVTQSDGNAIAHIGDVLDSANELVDLIHRLRNPNFGTGLLGFQPEQWAADANAFPLTFAKAASLIDPLVPAIQDATTGGVKFGNAAASTAFEVVLEIASHAELSLNRARRTAGISSDDMISIASARAVAEMCRDANCPPPVEWHLLKVLVDREFAAVVKALLERDNRNDDSKTQGSCGVALHDLAFLIDGDEAAATQTAKRWIDSKKIKAEKLGPCPIDRRKQLYDLSEMLSDVGKILALTPKEIEKYRQALVPKVRSPAPQINAN